MKRSFKEGLWQPHVRFATRLGRHTRLWDGGGGALALGACRMPPSTRITLSSCRTHAMVLSDGIGEAEGDECDDEGAGGGGRW